MPDHIEFDGVIFTAARIAAKEVGLSQDYLARLCKKGHIAGRRNGNAWYIDLNSLRGFLKLQEETKRLRHENLAKKLSHEYRANLEATAAVTPSKAVGQMAAPVAELPRELHRRFREIVEEGTGSDLAKSASNLPAGMAHAVLHGVPVDALAHASAYASSTVSLLERAIAVAATFMIVAGIIILVAPDQTRQSYQTVVADAGAFTVHLGAYAQSAQTYAMIETSRMQPLTAFLDTSRPRVALEVLPLKEAVQVTTAASASNRPVYDLSQLAAAGSALGVQNSAAPQAWASSSPSQGSAYLGSIATNVAFTGNDVSFGDIIDHDPTTDTYSLSKSSNDPNAFGVAVEQPALLFNTGNGNVPVMRAGSALVNVTLENGPIATGDPLTSSSIPGKARKANSGEHVIAIAGEAFSGAGGVSLSLPNGSSVLSGTIRADVNVLSSDASAQQSSSCDSLACQLASHVDPAIVRAFARYLLAALMASLALVFSYRSFMTDANYGVISIGRNPLAKSSIQAMVLLNALLAFAIASAGLFAAIFVLFALA